MPQDTSGRDEENRVVSAAINPGIGGVKMINGRAGAVKVIAHHRDSPGRRLFDCNLGARRV